MRKLFVGRIKQYGNLEHTRVVLQGLYQKVELELTKAERTKGMKNWILRLLIFRLVL